MIDRRLFISKTAAATAGLATALPRDSYAQRSPNDTINVAIIGLRGDNKGHPTWTARGRGLDHYEHLSGVKNVRITHVVDIDERNFASALPFARQQWGGDPKTETDFRRVLDNRDVDAVTIAAPDHWHALMTVMACQAGKDVYCEKPITAEEKGDSGQIHFQNFIDTMRSRKVEGLHAPLEEGHLSTSLCHLGNIAYRVGRSVKFDGGTERFVGDTEADALLSRTYRAPYVLPDRT